MPPRLALRPQWLQRRRPVLPPSPFRPPSPSLSNTSNAASPSVGTRSVTSCSTADHDHLTHCIGCTHGDISFAVHERGVAVHPSLHALDRVLSGCEAAGCHLSSSRQLFRFLRFLRPLHHLLHHLRTQTRCSQCRCTWRMCRCDVLFVLQPGMSSHFHTVFQDGVRDFASPCVARRPTPSSLKALHTRLHTLTAAVMFSLVSSAPTHFLRSVKDLRDRLSALFAPPSSDTKQGLYMVLSPCTKHSYIGFTQRGVVCRWPEHVGNTFLYVTASQRSQAKLYSTLARTDVFAYACIPLCSFEGLGLSVHQMKAIELQAIHVFQPSLNTQHTHRPSSRVMHVLHRPSAGPPRPRRVRRLRIKYECMSAVPCPAFSSFSPSSLTGDSLHVSLSAARVPSSTLIATAAMLARRPAPSQALCASVRALSDADKSRLYVCGFRTLMGIDWEWFSSAFRKAVGTIQHMRVWRPRVFRRVHVPLMLNDVAPFRQAVLSVTRLLLTDLSTSTSMYHVEAAFIPSTCPSLTSLYYNAKRVASLPMNEVSCPCSLPAYDAFPKLGGHVCARLSEPFMRELLGVPLHWNRNSTCLPSFSAITRQFTRIITRIFRRISQPVPPTSTLDLCAHAFLKPVYDRLVQTGQYVRIHDVLRHASTLRRLVAAPLDKSKGDMVWMCPLMYMRANWRIHLASPSYVLSTCNDDVVLNDLSRLPDFLDGPRIAKPRVSHAWGVAVLWPKMKAFRVGLHSWDDMKWRPLNSYYKHRFARVYNDVGRILSMWNDWREDHFSCMRIGSLFDALASHNRFIHGHAVLNGCVLSPSTVHVHDIGNFYPSCPRDDSLDALRALYDYTVAHTRYRFVNVPRAPAWPCIRSSSRLYPGLYGCMRRTTSSRVKPFFSTNCNYFSCRTYTLEDVLDVVKHDLAYSYTSLSGLLLFQREGFAQGSQLSPGLANIFAAHRERQFINGLSSDEREAFRFCFVRRWMDDRLLVVPPHACLPARLHHALSAVVDRLLVPTFYHDKCVLEKDESGVYVGCDVHIDATQVTLSQHNPNAHLLTPYSSHTVLPFIRYVHAWSSMSAGRKAHLVYSHLLRVLDYTMKEKECLLPARLRDCFHELRLFGYSDRMLSRQLYRILRFFPFLSSLVELAPFF